MNKTSIIEEQFSGFLKTNNLWKETNPLNIKQLNLDKNYDYNTLKIDDKLRLGKIIEHFIVHCLKQDTSIKIVAESLQIRQNKQTIGELDCLYIQNSKPFHLEIVYKFYLYDHSVGNNQLEHWIGPNRNDTLIRKLEKLKAKQFPLLLKDSTKPYLEKLGYRAEDFEQRLCFKAQLFVPLNKRYHEFKSINPKCISGYYIHFRDIDLLKDYSFYIPKKVDWLIEIKNKVSWLNFNEFIFTLKPLINTNKSPLCWLQKPDKTLLKCFVVWW